MNSSDLFRLIGKNIQSLRTEFKIGTQEKLAEDLDLSRSFISQLESPGVDKGVSLETLFLISQHYNIDIRRFFDNYEDLMDKENQN